ncbi:hypothetical protein ACFYZB_45585 [Streptomyces sp. NPDC001852]|uniref:hypothetical protein n=1 Tax=Streptomyces sp. NPDC001852 TaxID=3364619 RepID=UPI0036BDC3DA
MATPRGTLRGRAYTYRADGFLTHVMDQPSGHDWQFDLDSAGRPRGVTAGDWAEQYTYDAAGNRACAWWPDRAGNGESRGERNYDGTRLIGADGVRYEYNAAGRVVLRRKRRLFRKPDTWHCTWDAEDRLESVRGLMDDLDEELRVLSFDGPGDYRLRIHACGRDTATEFALREWDRGY